MPPESRYTFRPVAEGDLAMLRRWLAAPHVARWWGDPDEEIAGIREHMRSESVRPYIVMLAGEPLGYIQSYDMGKEADHPYAPQPAGTFGIDQSIGSAALTGRGHGPAMMRTFCARLFEKGASRIITDPDVENLNAIRAYEKAGFTKDKIITSEYGTVWLMMLDGKAQAPD